MTRWWPVGDLDFSDLCTKPDDPSYPQLHEDKEHPLFLFHAFHLLHTPLQVPKYYFQQIEKDVLQQLGDNCGVHSFPSEDNAHYYRDSNQYPF